MRVIFFACGLETPAARFRVLQLFPRLQAHGIECEFHYGYGRAYNRVASTPLGAPYKLVTRLKRGVQTLLTKNADIVFLQRTAIPQTALFEELASRRSPRVIFDFDDAIYLGPDGSPSASRGHATRRAIEVSSHVIVGNRHLADWVGEPHRTSVIPTAVDASAYTPGNSSMARVRDRVVIGWMGTSSNFDSLRTVLPALRRVLDRHPDVWFKIVSNARLSDIEGWSQVEQKAWSAADELQDLRSFDIGIMPLVNNEMSRGKCGFKLLLYMATGRPVVAAAVGANLEIVDEGSGFLARSDSDWEDALERLAANASMRDSYGRRGREILESRFSVDAVIPRYLEIFEKVAARR